MSLNISWIDHQNNNWWLAKTVRLEWQNTLSKVYKTTDVWLNRFRLTHKNIFDKIWWLNIKTHRALAQEIVNSKEVNFSEIELLLSDSNVDSNIRMELILALYNKNKKVDRSVILLTKSNLINIVELKDWVLILDNIRSYKQTLLVFKNWKIIKWYLESIGKDPNLEWWFIYRVSGYKKHKSSWEIAQ